MRDVVYTFTATDAQGHVTTQQMTVTVDDGPLGVPGSWLSVLSEEFTGTSLDTARWHPETGTYGSPGNRIQYYRPQNIEVSNGTCKLISKRESFAGKDFTAGMISTRDLGIYYPRFGVYEARMKVPHGQGLWPAFWLRHRDGSSICEPDIMEYFHGQIPGKVTGALHRTNNVGTFQNNISNRNVFFEAPTYTPGWHVFSIEITPEGDDVRFKWRLNGAVFANYLDTSATNWSTRHPGLPLFDITLQGCQIGGTWVGHPDDPPASSRWLNGCLISGSYPSSCSIASGGYTVQKASFPAVTEIDYVRMWVAA